MLTKPSWLRDILEHWLLNWHRGDLLSYDILGIHLAVPPWDILIGLSIESAIDWVIDGLNWIADGLERAADYLDDIWDWLSDQGRKLWDWFSNIDDWFYGKVWPWVQQVYGWVTDWFLGSYRWLIDAGATFTNWFRGIDDWFATRWRDLWGTVSGPIGNVVNFFNEFGKGIADFLNDPTGYIAALLGDALELFLQVAGVPLIKAVENFLDRNWEKEV